MKVALNLQTTWLVYPLLNPSIYFFQPVVFTPPPTTIICLLTSKPPRRSFCSWRRTPSRSWPCITQPTVSRHPCDSWISKREFSLRETLLVLIFYQCTHSPWAESIWIYLPWRVIQRSGKSSLDLQIVGWKLALMWLSVYCTRYCDVCQMEIMCTCRVAAGFLIRDWPV